MTREQIDNILSNGENETTEFKAYLREGITLTKLISSFSNHKGGHIIIGIKEPMNVVGCDPRNVTKIYQNSIKFLDPIPNTTLTFHTYNNKNIGIITVEKASTIVFSAEGAYKRLGDSNQLIPFDEIKQNIIHSAQGNEFETNITSLINAIEKQSIIIEKLREDIAYSGSFKSKLKDYLIGGVIGAVLGLICTLIFDN